MKQFLKTWGLLIIAVVIGVIAFFIATAYLANREDSLRDSILGGIGEKRAVVVATEDIPAGTPIGASNMAVAEVPIDHISSATVAPDQFEVYDGAVLKVPLSKGEPLLDHSVEGLLIDRFSELLKTGQRAVTIEVNTFTSNAGLLSVGDYVDIFLSGSFDVGPNPGKDISTPLFQRVKVLAVDRYPLLTRDQSYRAQSLLDEENELEFSSVTLRLESEEANKLAYASSIGDIVFLLRNADDDGQEGFTTLDTQKLLAVGNAGDTGTFILRSQSGSKSRSVMGTGSNTISRQDEPVWANRVVKRSVPVAKYQAKTKGAVQESDKPSSKSAEPKIEKKEEQEPKPEMQGS